MADDMFSPRYLFYYFHLVCIVRSPEIYHWWWNYLLYFFHLVCIVRSPEIYHWWCNYLFYFFHLVCIVRWPEIYHWWCNGSRCILPSHWPRSSRSGCCCWLQQISCQSCLSLTCRSQETAQVILTPVPCCRVLNDVLHVLRWNVRYQVWMI